MDYETNYKCIICKNQMFVLCCLVEMEFTLSFIHMLMFFHTHASVKCYNISVNVVVYLCTLMPE